MSIDLKGLFGRKLLVLGTERSPIEPNQVSAVGVPAISIYFLAVCFTTVLEALWYNVQCT
jgi:hypothetical protein